MRVVLPEPGGASEHDREVGPDAGGEEAGSGPVDHVALDELVEGVERDSGEAADVDHGMAAAADVGVDDVQSGAVVELGVLQSFGRVELSVAGGGVVEELREDPGEVVAVVEDLVVIAGGPDMSLYEDGVGGVDHDLPHVSVVEQGSERPVAGQVAEGPLGHLAGGGEVEGPLAALEVVAPLGDLVGDERLQAPVGVGAGHVVGEILGPALHPSLDLDERAQVVGVGVGVGRVGRGDGHSVCF